MEFDVLKELIENDPFLKVLGIRVEKIERGSCRLSVNFTKELPRFGDVLNGV
jgi:acyl-coenzyme A thioesterase PaaI-like protein